MKVAVYSPFAMLTPHFETDLELVQRHAEAGDEVTLLVCRGELEACEPNYYHDRTRCLKCIGRMLHGTSLISDSVRVESFFRLTDANRAELEQLQTEFSSQREIEEFYVEQFDIGYAALSSLISKFRDPKIDFSPAQTKLLKRFLRTGLIAYRSMQHFLRENPTDVVYLFNGRFAALRGVMRACEQAGVECQTHERGHTNNHFVRVKNTTLHDWEHMQHIFPEAWEKAASPAREEIVENWFSVRREGVDRFSFTKNQTKGVLPENWDSSKHNVAIYVSSEDEYAGLGDEWKNPLYNTQLDGIQQILRSLERENPHRVHLYLRVHPNLSFVRNDQTRGIEQLDSPYLTVIPPAHKIDSYALLDAADSALTFGSCMGIEANYWKCPSILGGICFYRNMGATYNPETHEELMQLLQQKLTPLDNTPAYIYAHYWATYGEPFEHFVADSYSTGMFRGVRIKPSNAMKAKALLLELAYPRRMFRNVWQHVHNGLLTLENRLKKAG